MGVPALFRWLSKKYPKIVAKVTEDEPVTVTGDDGEKTEIPVDMSRPNPNGFEIDSLYLDMNGIVHPCTHPEGKPPPETEEDMMAEVFKYTERVVNMARPRKLLFMAIDGVAPRAKMNQQRSRRFRSAQEAKEKEEQRKEGIAMYEAMGIKVSDETKNQKSWDSNAITPGTPFMDLLATSLRYWVVHKMNTDPGWKDLQVILSDASVPGEGEHKIMDFIRRQRVHPEHDPNTQHVIYGLDADLIMLALATHEPNFRVLREDVFFQGENDKACRICGEQGHFAAQCTGLKKPTMEPDSNKPVQKKPQEKKPFIFLDVTVLREYLEVELNLPYLPFPFDLEMAIDDWVFLIFFVGNDFLPHLPSLEIREGAIDTLLKIWKDELPRMGGYLTRHGAVELARAEIILEGLAKREDEIFRKRREAEERQEQNNKRRRVEIISDTTPSQQGAPPQEGIQATAIPYTPIPVPVPSQSIHHSLPSRPAFDLFTGVPEDISPTIPPSHGRSQNFDIGVRALAGSNSDVVKNRAAIRMANMNAAEILKAELSSSSPSKKDSNSTRSTPFSDFVSPPMPYSQTRQSVQQSVAVNSTTATAAVTSEATYFANGPPALFREPAAPSTTTDVVTHENRTEPEDSHMNGNEDPTIPDMVDLPNNDAPNPVQPDAALGGQVDVVMEGESSPRGMKRKLEELEEEEAVEESFIEPEEEEEEEVVESTPMKLKVNPDGTVEQEDKVKLWEPGYKERYYRQKFGVELSDTELRKKVTKAYVEGLSWVLHYYYQGTPSWQWYYPFHYAPFASDFEEVSKMDIKFEVGMPFKPFEQLMGVFPASSRHHIPLPFANLMIEEDSPILDFYPTGFEIDMNGKKMAWQGVALLPFIDPKRLLEALTKRYHLLTPDEVRRNKWGSNAIFVSEENRLYDFFCGLYTKEKRKIAEPVPIDAKVSKGLAGTVLADPLCVPGSTYSSPLPTLNLPDIDDRSISALYYFPKQITPHRSKLLPNHRRGRRTLTASDEEYVRRGGGSGRGRGGMRDSGQGWNMPGRDRDRENSRSGPYGGYSSSYGDPRSSYDGGRGRDYFDSRPSSYSAPPYSGRGGGYGSSSYNGSGSNGYSSRAAPHDAPYSAGGGRGGYTSGYGGGRGGYSSGSSGYVYQSGGAGYGDGGGGHPSNSRGGAPPPTSAYGYGPRGGYSNDNSSYYGGRGGPPPPPPSYYPPASSGGYGGRGRGRGGR